MGKLKLTLDQIHWSLVLRAVLFGLVWFFLPLWAFFIVAAYLYLVPLFRPFRLAPPLLITLFFAAVHTPSFWLAVLLAVLFYLILGIKDLIFIDRFSAYELLALLIVFVMLVKFFSFYSGGFVNAAFFASSLMAGAYFLLVRSFGDYEVNLRTGGSFPRRLNVFAAATAFIFWQLALSLLFLPLNYFYQSAVLFVVAAVFIEWLRDYLAHNLRRSKLLWSFSILFVVLILVFGTVEWGL